MEKELMIPTDDYFESTLSSMVSSPTSGDGMMIRELIGRLCDSSPQSCIATPDNTPLNSPPKLYLHTSTNFPNHPPTLPFFNADPGFAERAAKFSSFGTNLQLHGNSHRPLMLDSTEPSSVSQHNPVGEIAISRKRKSISKPKLKDSKGETKKNEGSPNAKRSKTDEDEAKKENAEESKDNNYYNNSNNYYNNSNSNNNDNDNISNNKETANTEPPKDYIHVRARRGQATDSHSLAERVRREKISERMKFLQDLVPGCNKVTGKATVLDEIINYVQSLQHQVEFLSMKLATMNPRMDFNILSKDMFQCRESALPQTMYPLDQTFGLQPPSIGGLTNPLTQFPTFWDDDLQSLVQMGIAQNQTQTGSGTLSKTQMKAEL